MKPFDDEFYALLATKNNRELADMYGVSRSKVQNQRVKQGVPNPRSRKPKVDVSQLDDRFWRLLSEGAHMPGLALQYQIPYHTVWYLKAKITQRVKGRTIRTYPETFWTELFQLSAQKLAVKYKTSAHAVYSFRRKLNASLSQGLRKKRLTPDEVRLKLGVHLPKLGNMTDELLSKIVGLRPATLRRYREVLNIPKYRGSLQQLELPLGMS